MPEFIKACNDRATIIDIKIGGDYKAMLEQQEQRFRTIWDEVKGQYTR